jgi:hypothetical protein
MDNFISPIITVIEFFILGCFAAVGAYYIGIFYHPIYAILREFPKFVRKFIDSAQGNHPDHRFTSIMLIILCLGGLYFLGAVMNVSNYWILEPVHNHLIAEIYNDTPYSNSIIAMQSKNKFDLRYFYPNPFPESDLLYLSNSFWAILPLRIFDNFKDAPALHSIKDIQAYRAYTFNEALIRSKDSKSLQGTLDDLRKFIRIIRGVAVFGYLLIWIALIKIVIALVNKRILTSSSESSIIYQQAFWVYKNFFDRELYFNGSIIRDKIDRNNLLRNKILIPNLSFLIIGLLFFIFGIYSYRAAETEYQLFVYYGGLIAQSNIAHNAQQMLNEAGKFTQYLQ